MFISDFAIRRPVITVVSMLALVVFGLVSLVLLQTDEFPDVAVPLVVVAVPYPGASPDNVEREIVEPLEEAIAGISGVKKVTSNALDGFATVLVEFNYEKDLQEATQEIRDEINAIRNDLPAEMKEPVLTRVNPTDFPIVSLALASDTMSVAQLTLLADPGHHAAAAGDPRRRRGRHRRRQHARDDGRPPARRAAGGQRQRRRGRRRAAAQNLAAPVGRLLGAHDERTIRLGGRVETRRGLRATSSSPIAAAGSSGSATSRRCTSASRSRGRRRSSAARKRSASTSRSPRATARRPSPTSIRARDRRDPDDAAARRRRSTSSATPACA